jgi:hypothetical protein
MLVKVLLTTSTSVSRLENTRVGPIRPCLPVLIKVLVGRDSAITCVRSTSSS